MISKLNERCDTENLSLKKKKNKQKIVKKKDAASKKDEEGDNQLVFLFTWP